jgi:phosphate:Na+ symporter
MEIFVDVLAGLGLFFVGVKLIASHLKQLSGPWFRRLVDRATRTRRAAALLGILSGALTQSSSAITFISISVVTAGLADVARVLPMVIWANAGTSVLVLLSSIDISHAVLFLLGVTGIAYYFDVDKSPRLRHLFGSLLGLGLLFLGLELIKDGAEPLKSMEAVRDFLGFAASSTIAAFLVGAVLAIVAQSSAMVSIVAVTMVNVGILTLDQTIVIVMGASLGSGLATLLLSANLTGIGRQIAYVQVAVKALGVAVLLPLFLLETHGMLPGIKALAMSLAADASTQVALVYLFLQLVSVALGSLFQGQLLDLAVRLSPPTAEEALSRPHYIYPEAASDPRTALALAEKEQGRIFGFLPEVVDAVRPDGAGSGIDVAALNEAGASLSRRVEEFLTELLDNTESRDLTVEIVNVEKRNEVLKALTATVREFAAGIPSAAAAPAAQGLAATLGVLAESLHAVLFVTADALGGADLDDMPMLFELTSDRSAQMERIRRRVMAQAEDLTPVEHDQLYMATTLFERSLWLVRRYLSLFRDAVPRVGSGG